MKKTLVAFLLIVMGIIVIESCKHIPPEPVFPADPGTTPPAPGGGQSGSNLVCFETEILPIFQSNCAKSGCHDAITREEGYVFDSYENIIRKDIRPGSATNSEVYEVLFETGNDKMPPPPNPDLTAAQKALIGRWINEGARNTTNCGTACDANQFKYGANISNIFTNYCVGCHGGSAPSAGINLSNYAGVSAVVSNGRLLGSITHASGYSPMPKNAAKLSDCQITQVTKWIAAGALNN